VKNTNHFTLREALQEFLHTYHLDEKLLEKQVIRSWGEVMGKMVGKHTVHLAIRRKVLYVKLDSAALRNELSYAREQILNALNHAVNATAIKDVIIQ
jgi:predicted nucleic acid-binding Zn ribbon protein